MPESSHAFKRPCPVCAAAAGSSLGELKFELFDDAPIDGIFELAACPDCGLVFYDAQIDPAAIETYYRNNLYYASAEAAGVGGDSPEDVRHQEEIAERLKTLGDADLNSPVFDVGCGRGGLLGALKRAGFQKLYAVDLLAETAALVGRRLGMPSAQGSAARLPFPEVEPGLLIYSHVLEHAAEPGRILAEAQKRLAKGGLIYVEVPDASGYEMNIPFQEFYLEHLNHFDPASLRVLLSRNGFAPLTVERAEFRLPGGRALRVVWALARPILSANEGLQGDFAEARNHGASLSGSKLFKRRGHSPAAFEKGEAAGHLEKYLNWSRRHPALKVLEELAASGRPLWVWGVSQMVMLLLGSSPLSEAGIAGFLDRDPYKSSQRLKGLPIQNPSVLSGRPPGEDLLLAAWGHEFSMRAALAELDFHGLVHTISGS